MTFGLIIQEQKDHISWNLELFLVPCVTGISFHAKDQGYKSVSNKDKIGV